MQFRFISPNLRAVDACGGEVLACCLFEDERPIRGLASLIDWRMTARLSRHMQQGNILGAVGETVLIPAKPRVPFDKLLLFGLGPIRFFDETVFEKTIANMLQTLSKMRVRVAVVERPGRHTGLIDAPRAIELILQACEAHVDQDAWTLVEDIADQKSAMQHLAQLRRTKGK